MASELATRIEAELKNLPGQTARQLALVLNEHKSNVNSCMYGNAKFVKDDSPRPCWFLAEAEKEVSEPPKVTKKIETKLQNDLAIKDLRPWQEVALKAWNDNECQGIVEAVTGAGKTRLAIAAIAQELSSGGKVAIIVPTIELQQQWERQITHFFPTTLVGLLGNGNEDFLTSHDIIIAIVHSASQYELGLSDNELGLLVADECQRYPTDMFRKALEDRFKNRLGLTATRERTDGAHRDLDRYFGGVVYSLGYREAIDNQYISEVAVAQIAVDLTSGEQIEFDELSESISSIQIVLSKRFSISLDPYPKFIEEIVRIAADGDMRDSMAAKKYLSSISKRKALLANTPQKLKVLKHLAPAVLKSNGAIFFTETIASAEAIAAQLNKNGVNAATIHSGLDSRERHQTFLDFGSRKLKALTAARVLDEGVDVPEADLAVIIAASKTRRQMIQRMGRVLRPKADGRTARFVLVYVANTSEDPQLGAHDAFWSEVIDIASASQLFSVPQDNKKLINFLDPKKK